MARLLVYLFAFTCLIAFILIMNRKLNKEMELLQFVATSIIIFIIYLAGSSIIVALLK